MDAKPQRPRIRAFRDENQIPSLNANNKSLIHNRHKSSPNLSSFVGGQTAKNTGRRTVFADLSNNKRSGAVKDDTALLKKNLISERIPESDESKCNATLNKPAQRPSTIGLRSVFGNFLQNTTSQSNKSIPIDPQLLAESKDLNSRKTITRKSTKVFREESAGPVKDEDKFDASKFLGDGPILLDDNFVDTTSSTEKSNLASALSSLDLSKIRLATADSKSSDEHERPVTSGSANTVYEDVKSEGVKLDSISEAASENADELQLPEYLVNMPPLPEEALLETFDDHVSHYNSVPPGLSEVNTFLDQANLEDQTHPQQEQYYAAVETPYDNYLDDDGYTTGRSFKSRGDCTTTGPTTAIMAPKVTAKVERELADARRFVETCTETKELEEDETWDTSMVAEYGQEIFEYYHDLEVRMCPNAHYMDNQNEVQWSMRSVLMDWLVQVHHRFNLLPETLYLCVNYIDRFLSCKVVSLAKLQLVGATAIFVAAKYEEINCPSVQEIVYMVDNGYTVDEVLKAERYMLTMLQFELGWPGPMSFLRRISKADDYDHETRTLAKYFLEITIMDERFVGTLPSYSAAGAHCLARMMLHKGDWSLKHVHYSGYTYSQLRPLLTALMTCVEEPVLHHQAIYEKYLDRRYKAASEYVQKEIKRGFNLPAARHHYGASHVDSYSGSLS